MRHAILLCLLASTGLSACSSPEDDYLSSCNQSAGAAIGVMLKSPKVPASAYDDLRKAGAGLCACRVMRIGGLKDVSAADKDAFFRDGLDAAAISPKGRAPIKAAFNACGKRFGAAIAAALKKAKPAK